MKEQFATYEIAKKLKPLGFNKECIGIFDREGDFYFINNPQKPINKHDFYYNQDCLAPLWQQVIDWLREEHKIIVDVTFDIDGLKRGKYIWFYVIMKDFRTAKNDDGEGTEDYYKVRELAVLKALDLINK